MSDVKRYYVGINTKCLGGIGLVEMTDLYREATGFDGLVMGKDYDAIKVENESLRSDIQSWRLSIEAERNAHKLSMKGIQDEIDRLNGPSFTVELAALRKDAERYRFIRDDRSSGKTDICIIRKDWTACRDTYLTLEQADYAIDAAISSPENPS